MKVLAKNVEMFTIENRVDVNENMFTADITNITGEFRNLACDYIMTGEETQFETITGERISISSYTFFMGERSDTYKGLKFYKG